MATRWLMARAPGGGELLLIGDKLRRAVQGFFDRINSIFGLSLQDSRLHL
jgi:hypothetical protein